MNELFSNCLEKVDLIKNKIPLNNYMLILDDLKKIYDFIEENKEKSKKTIGNLKIEKKVICRNCNQDLMSDEYTSESEEELF